MEISNGLPSQTNPAQTPASQETSQTNTPPNSIPSEDPKHKNVSKTIFLIIASLAAVLLIGSGAIFLSKINNIASSAISTSKVTLTPTSAVTPTPTSPIISNISLPEEILNSRIFYSEVRTGGIYLLDGIKSIPIQIASTTAELNGAVISSDRTKLYYSNIGMAIYDVFSKKSTQVTSDEHLPPRRLLLSPDEKFIYLEHGTGVVGRGEIITNPGFSIVGKSFSVYGNKEWLDNTTLVFSSSKPMNRPWEAGDGGGISIITLPSGKQIDLLIPDKLNDYVLSAVSDKNIYYQINTVVKEEDWVNANLIVTYWMMNKDGSKKQQIQEQDFPGEYVRWTKIITDNSPSQYAKYEIRSIQPNLQMPTWLLFNLYRSGSSTHGYPDSIIALINIDNPQQTFTVIGKGIWPLW